MPDKPIVEVPDRCPKGHQIWWFSLQYDRVGWRGDHAYGVCAGQVIQGRYPDVRVGGLCRYVWLWPADGRGLDTVASLSQELLVDTIRALAYQTGIFRTRAPEVADAAHP